MAKKDARSFWIVLGTFACIHPVTFLMLQSLSLTDYQGMSAGRGLVMIVTMPLFAIMSSALVMPVTLLTGALCAVWSRKTQSSVRWVLRSALLSALVATCSYIPLYLIFHMSMEAWLVWPSTMLNAALAGALSAWTSQRWRPRDIASEETETSRAQAQLEVPVTDDEFDQESIESLALPARKKSSFLGLVLVFATVGPLIAWTIYTLSLVALFAAVGVSVIIALATSLAVFLIFVPLGSVSGLIAGFFSGLVSRGTLSTARWYTYTAALGGGVSVLSIQTALVAYLLASERGILGSIAYSTGIMFVIGALSALACAWICRGFRPSNLNLPAEPSASIASPR